MFRGLCVCLLDITMSCAKKAKPIKMLFGMWTRVGPRNHEWRVRLEYPQGMGNLGACNAAFHQIFLPFFLNLQPDHNKKQTSNN